MGRLTLLLGGNDETPITLNAPSYLTEDKISELNDFLTTNNTSLEESYIDFLSNYLLQMNGYFSQLLVRSEGLISKTNQEKYKTKSKLLEEREKNKTKSNLEEVIKEYFSLYNETNQSVLETINHNNEKKELAQIISTVNDLLVKIDMTYVESNSKIDSDLLKIAELYKKALTEQGSMQMATLIQLLDEEKRVVAKEKNDASFNKVNVSKEKEFNLFDKINDQIVDKKFKKENSLIYAKYELEDGSSYYAIIPDGNKVLAEDKEFRTFSNFEMNKNKIIENLKLIVNNMMIYYDLNEYTRYVEMIYKKQMTKDVDQAIGQYKMRLATMENIINGQLSFMNDIAPILNGKSTTKYPNIVYNDIPIKDFYYNELNNPSIEENIKEQDKLMIKLTDDTMPNVITAKQVLTAIYGTNIVNDLTNEFLIDTEEKIVNMQSIDKTDNNNQPNTVQMVTNYQKISDYIQIRKDQLNKVSNGVNDTSITEDKNSIYQNVNSIFDLNIAAAISDNLYSSGQGIYAITQYLKNGDTNRFTSSYNARNLASSVNPNNYIALLMENIVKSFAGSGKKASEDATYLDRMQQIILFVKDELSKEVFSADEMKDKLLNNDNILSLAIKNFDYDYLDPISENSKLFDQAIEIGVNNNNLSAIKIKQALVNIKSLAKENATKLGTQSVKIAA